MKDVYNTIVYLVFIFFSLHLGTVIVDQVTYKYEKRNEILIITDSNGNRTRVRSVSYKRDILKSIQERIKNASTKQQKREARKELANFKRNKYF